MPRERVGLGRGAGFQAVVHLTPVVRRGGGGWNAQLLDGVDEGEAGHAEKKLGLMAATINKARGLMARLIKRRKA